MPRKTIRTTKKSPATVKAALRKRRLLSKRTVSTKTTTKKKTSATRATHKKVSSTPPPPALVPESFHNTAPSLSSIKLSSQKPFWLLAQWHLSLSDLEIWRRRAPGGELTLRLYTEKGQCLQTTAVPGVVRNWHLYTDTTACAFYVELGYLNKDNQFECLCRSSSVKPLAPKPEATAHKNFRSTQSNPVILKESVQRKLVQSFHVTSAPSYGGS